MTADTDADPTVLAINVDGDQVGSGWGRARTIAIATVSGEEITDWQEHPVAWDVAHDEGTEGSHHARIVRFLREHHAQAAITGHMGQPMAHTLTKLGVLPLLGGTGDARRAAVVGAAMVREALAGDVDN